LPTGRSAKAMKKFAAALAASVHVKRSSEGVRLMELQHGECRYPLGPRDEMAARFCGAPTVAGKQYCARHFALAYKAPKR